MGGVCPVARREGALDELIEDDATRSLILDPAPVLCDHWKVPETTCLPDPLAAAGIALAALESSLGMLAPIQWYIILPSETGVGRHDVMQFLAKAPKPIMCVGARLPGTLAVGCWTLPQDDLSPQRSSHAHGTHHHPVSLPAPGCRVLVRDSEHSWGLVSSCALADWIATYSLPQVDFSVVDPDAQALSAGASATLKFYKQTDTVGGVLVLPEQ